MNAIELSSWHLYRRQYLHVLMVLVTPPVASERAFAADQNWEVEVHGGPMLSTNPTSGTTALPSPGALIAVPPPVNPAVPNRVVSSWYFGDGASLLNLAMASFRLNGRVVPLDPVLQSRFVERRSGSSIGVRIDRGFGARFGAELALDGTFGPLHPDKISEANANFFGLDTTNDQDSKDDIVAAEMAIPVNHEIHLLMHSKDVGHSFYVPELRVQQDFVPGLDVSIHFTATKIGRYEIVCTQLCGLGHYNMKAYLEVKSQDDYDSWIKQQAALQ